MQDRVVVILERRTVQDLPSPQKIGKAAQTKIVSLQSASSVAMVPSSNEIQTTSTVQPSEIHKWRMQHHNQKLAQLRVTALDTLGLISNALTEAKRLNLPNDNIAVRGLNDRLQHLQRLYPADLPLGVRIPRLLAEGKSEDVLLYLTPAIERDRKFNLSWAKHLRAVEPTPPDPLAAEYQKLIKVSDEDYALGQLTPEITLRAVALFAVGKADRAIHDLETVLRILRIHGRPAPHFDSVFLRKGSMQLLLEDWSNCISSFESIQDATFRLFTAPSEDLCRTQADRARPRNSF